MEDVKPFRIQVGGYKAEFRLFSTNAPSDYDAKSTITLYSETAVPPQRGESRFVLIEVSQVEWHLLRYASGLYRCNEEEIDNSLAGYIAEKLVGRLRHMES